MTRPAVLAAAVCATIAASAPAPAAAQSVVRDPVVVVGLRPTLGDRPGQTDIRRLSEAQRLRETAGGVIRTVAQRPVINHIGLREILGSAYLVDFVECRSEIRCVSRVIAPLTRRTADAVFGEYTVERDTYTFQVRLIDARAARVVREVQFAMRESELEDRKIWRRELAKLFGGEAPAVEPTPPAKTEGGLPELAPITSDPEPGATEPGAPSSAGTPPASGSGEAFVDDAALDAISRGVPLHGHFQNYAALGARDRFSRDILIFDNRLQLEFESSISTLRVVGKPQLLFDWLSEEFRIRFREVFAARYYESFDISVGERILTWGVTDFWPVADIINPRDFSRLQNWRPIDEKLPVPVVHSAAVFGPLTLHLLAIPLTRNSEFQLDQTAPFALPIPAPPGVAIEQPDLPRDLDASGGGAALDIALSSWKLSLYGLWGRNPLPTIYALADPETMALSIQVENERVAMGAMSLQGNIDAIETLIKAEAAAYARVDDRCEGRDAEVDGVPGCFYLRQVPSGRATLAIERTLVSGLDAHLQFISEVTRAEDVPPVPDVVDVIAPGFPAQEKYSPILTLRLQARWLGDDFRPMAFAYWSIADEDFFVNTDIEYHVADGFALALGGFWFQGYAANPDKNRYTLAGSLESSSNAYLRATAWF